LYMVHGFHFYKGASLINWMLYYPIEWMMAPKADCMCTVHKEDYHRAQKLKVAEVRYIHGVGIDVSRLSENRETDIRKELDLDKDVFIVLSVGELNKNKNQQVIMRAIARLKDKNIHYLLCGKGAKRKALEKLSKKLKIDDQVHFLGYRKDVVDICSQADVFAMPSKREGLPVASLEAMYCGLPLVTSNIRGLSDITADGVTGYTFKPDDINGFAEGIRRIKSDSVLRMKMKERNRLRTAHYQLENTEKEIMEIIRQLI